MTDGFGPRWSAGAVAGPVVAALLAGSAAYALQQDAFASVGGPDATSPSAKAGDDQALVALQKAVKKEQRRIEQIRTDLRHTQEATRRTLAAARVAQASSGSTWTSGGTSSSGWTPSGSSGSTSSGGSGGSGGSVAAPAPAPAPTTQSTTGASGAAP